MTPVSLDFEILGDGTYRLKSAMTYYSPRYKKSITCPVNMKSDGASGPAEDIVSRAWWFHDRLWGTLKWDAGTACSRFQANLVLYDMLREEGRWFRAHTWLIGTTFNAVRLAMMEKI